VTSKRSVKDRAAEQANYTAWKILAGADLLGRHDVKPGTIPERLWRRLYIQGRSPQTPRIRRRFPPTTRGRPPIGCASDER
jgi:dihydropteroate synthase